MFRFDVRFCTREEAEKVLNYAKEIVGEYGNISVMDLFDLTNGHGQYNGHFKTWTDVDDAWILESEDGCYLVFPEYTDKADNKNKIDIAVEIQEILENSGFGWRMSYDPKTETYCFKLGKGE